MKPTRRAVQCTTVAGGQHGQRLDEGPAVVRPVVEAAVDEVVGDVDGRADQAARAVQDAGDARHGRRRPHGRQVAVVVEDEPEPRRQPEQQRDAQHQDQVATGIPGQQAEGFQKGQRPV